jgi:cytochrome P450
VALLRHPAQRDALVADPGLAARVVEEVMRWDAPVPHSTFRFATEEIRIGDAVIPAYAQVIVSLAAANRDPPRYRDPEAFDISRTDGGILRWVTASTTASARRRPGCRDASRSPRCTPASPAMRLAVDLAELRSGHGDGLVLRGLSELPVVLRR